MKKIYILLTMILFTAVTNAQVSGIKTIGVDYPTLAAAITDLNTVGVGVGGATINVPAGYTETAPSGGYVLGTTLLNATLIATNPLVIKKNGAGANPLFTAFTGGTSITSDGVIKLAGTDYVTIDGLNVVENAANSGAAFMEWGIALVNLNASAPFDGCQNVTIKNCSVTLDRTNPNGAFGIYSAHNIATSATGLTITAVGDLHSNNKFYSNTISNVNEGIWLLGFAAASPYTLFDQNNDVGGNSPATGNTVRTMGVTALFNTFCIYLNFQNGANISYNTIDNGFGGATNTTQLMGIFTSGATASATVLNNNVTLTTSGGTSITGAIYTASTGSLTANNNTVSLNTSAGSGTHYGIYSASVATTNILNNNLTANNTGAVTGALYFIYNAGAATIANINNNTISNANLTTTSTTGGIYNAATLPTLNVNNNTISNISRTSASGTHYCFYTGSPANGTYDGNTVDGISFTTVTSTGTIYGIYDISSGVNMTYTNNVIKNLSTPTTGTLYGIREFGTAGIKTIQNNQVYNFSTSSGGAGGFSATGISWLTGGNPNDISNNRVYSINSTGTTGGTAGAIIGILCSGVTNNNIYKNKVYDLSTNSTGATLWGMQVTSGTTNNIYNNLVGDLRAPKLNAGISLAGINCSGGTTDNVYYNTVYLNNVSAGALFGSSAIYASTTPTVTLRNNIFVNLSKANGATGFTTAYRRTTTTLTTYGATSNNNLFYSGGQCTNSLIYYDGTFSAQTLAAYQALATLAPRDNVSKTENPNFLSTTGALAAFLHINPAIATVIESGGANIATYTDDYDGDVRNAATPDIGADEFTGTIAAACAGAPAAGVAAAATNPLCSGLSTNICLSGYSSGVTGITFQWQSAPALAGPYTNIACANSSCYNTGNLAAGTYYYQCVVTCTNGGGTATSNVVTLVVNPTPVVTVNPPAPTICNGSSTPLTASGAVTYTWSPATGLSSTTGTTVTASPTVTTTYTVIGTDAAGCVSLPATVTVTVNPSPAITSVTATPSTICYNSNSQLQVNTAGPAAYCASTHSSGCGLGDEITNVVLNTLTNPSGCSATAYTYYTPTPTTTLTAGSTYNLTVSFGTDGNQYFGAWIDYDNDGVLSASEFLGASTNAGSNGTISISFTVPAGALNGVTRLRIIGGNDSPPTSGQACGASSSGFGETEDYDITISGGATPFTYNWSPVTFLNNATIANPLASNVTATTLYSVTVTGGNGCPSTGNVTVTVNNPDAIATPASQSICTGNSITPIILTSSTGGSTFTWTRNNPGITGTIGNSGSGTPISGTLINAGTLPVTVTFTITPSNSGCTGTGTYTATVTVNPTNTIALSSAPGTNAQTVCINTPITNITYTTTGATGATFSGLPAGLTGSWASNVVTISGSPSTTVGSPFSYTVTLTGGCGSVTANGTITVTANNTITLTSAAGTDAQSVCQNSGISNITYSTSGATGATFSGLPAGVTGVWAGNIVTISGTPTAAPATYNYTVTLTGGCGSVTANGSITVKPLPIISSIQVEPTTCASADGSITLTISGAAGPYTFVWTGPGVNPSSQNQTGLTVGTFTVTVTAANSCTATATISLIGPGGCSICPAIGSFTSNPSGGSCSGNPITLTASGLSNMGTTYGIIFKQSASALPNPYIGGTIIATIANGALTSGGTVATTTTTLPSGSYFIYVILTPTPVDPLCRPSALVNHTVSQTPDVNQPANQSVCNNTSTAAVNFTGSVPGTVFNWTNNTTSIGLAASGSGNIASFTATNGGITPVVATITVTPSATSNIIATQTFNYTGAIQTWTVPAGITSITINAAGAQGGAGSAGSDNGSPIAGGAGGLGTKATGTLAVTPGQVLNIFVGGAGTTGTGGFNGGGAGGNTLAGGGGGASDVRYPGVTAADRIITGAGGGGGGRGGCEGSTGTPGTGGAGGNGDGNGVNGGDSPTAGGFAGGGFGAIGSSFGAKGIGCAGFSGNDGTAGNASGIGGAGGDGQNCCCFSFGSIPGGGGGGGGFVGGGGAGGGSAGTVVCSGNDKGAGGGGAGGTSNTSGVSGGSTALGSQAGNGLVTISYALTPITCTGTSKTFTITVNPTPSATIAYTGSPYCSNAGTAAVTQTGTTGGVYTATPAGLTLNAATGAVTLGTSTAGTYTVTYTIAAAGGCAQFTTTATITINAAPSATISYAGTPYCSTTLTATVTRTGTAGGTYSSTAGLTINAATGTVTPNTSTPGTYTVTYSIAAGGGCGAFSTTTSITITQVPNMIIMYLGSPYCSNAGIATVSQYGTPGGTYSASPAGLTLNAATGAVTLGTSTAGTYTVTYSVIVAGCGTTITTTTITITAAPAATIAYTGSPYCANAGTATVTRTGTAGGTYSSTAGLTINAATGAVTLGTSTPGTYTVTYTIAASGGCGVFTTTATITITALPAATISYAGSPYCQNAGVATVTRTGTAGGTYSSTAGLSINAATGDVNLAASTAGTYTVTYTIAAGGGCGAVTATTTITITTLPAATISYAGNPFCQNAGTATVTRTGTAGGTYSAAPAGLTINAATGAVTLGTSTPGTYTVSYTIAAGGGCGAVTATTSITVSSLSVAPTGITVSQSVLCGPTTVTLSVTGGSLGSGASWKWYTGSCGGTLVGTGASITILVNATTTYFVRAEGACNTTTCASQLVTVSVQPVISIAASPYTSLMPFMTTTLTATVTPADPTNTTVWYRNGTVVPGASGLTLVVGVDALGLYTARTTTTLGCTAISNAVLIKDTSSDKLFITPNPNDGRFKVRYYSNPTNLGFRHLVIFAEDGEKVYDKIFGMTAPYSSIDVDVRNLAKGFYMVMVVDNVGNKVLATGKVVLQ